MPIPETELKSNLIAKVPPSSTYGQILLINDVPVDYTITAANIALSTGIFTVTGHDFLDDGYGTAVTIANPPNPLAAGTPYWVRDVTANTFKLSATPGGAAIASFISHNASSTIISDMRFNASALGCLVGEMTTSVAQWVRKELTDYQGVGGRLAFNTPAADAYVLESFNSRRRAKVEVSLDFDNRVGAALLSATQIVLITGGSLAIGSTTGAVKRFWNEPLVVTAGTPASRYLGITEANS